MASLKEVDQPDVKGSDRVPAVDPERDQPAEALLGLSEEKSLKDQQPFDCHCYSDLDEAVRGWARVAPLAGIFLQQKKEKQCKPKKTRTLWSTDTKCREENCSATFTHDESHVELEQKSCCGGSGAATMQQELPASLPHRNPGSKQCCPWC